MKNINQQIDGNQNIQVAGDLIKTEKIIRKTEVIYDKDEYITDSQAKEIRDRITKIANSRLKEDSSSFKKAYNSLYSKFKITKYNLLPKDDYEKAIKWLDKQIAINRPKLKNVDHEQWRKDIYKSLHARSRQLGINIHDFAYTEFIKNKSKQVNINTVLFICHCLYLHKNTVICTKIKQYAIYQYIALFYPIFNKILFMYFVSTNNKKMLFYKNNSILLPFSMRVFLP